jgi:hypothetical protein
MTIPILTEIASAFDILSILEIKIRATTGDKKRKLEEQKISLQEQINLGIGYEKGKKLYHSKEYTDLYNANFEIFELIEKSQENAGILLKEADQLNYRRFLAKKELQEKHFGKPIEEVKIGY